MPPPERSPLDRAASAPWNPLPPGRPVEWRAPFTVDCHAVSHRDRGDRRAEPGRDCSPPRCFYSARQQSTGQWCGREGPSGRSVSATAVPSASSAKPGPVDPLGGFRVRTPNIHTSRPPSASGWSRTSRAHSPAAALPTHHAAIGGADVATRIGYHPGRAVDRVRLRRLRSTGRTAVDRQRHQGR